MYILNTSVVIVSKIQLLTVYIVYTVASQVHLQSVLVRKVVFTLQHQVSVYIYIVMI